MGRTGDRIFRRHLNATVYTLRNGEGRELLLASERGEERVVHSATRASGGTWEIIGRVPYAEACPDLRARTNHIDYPRV
jgi:hypothetical protein